MTRKGVIVIDPRSGSVLQNNQRVRALFGVGQIDRIVRLIVLPGQFDPRDVVGAGLAVAILNRCGRIIIMRDKEATATQQ